MGRTATDFDEMDDETNESRGNRKRWGIIAVVVVAFFVHYADSSGPAPSYAGAGWPTDWNAAAIKSRDSGKPALILFTADWCSGCRSFETDVLARPDVKQYLEDRYTLLRVDLTRRDSPNHAIANQYKIEVYPTLILFGRRGGGEVARCYGMNAKELVMRLRSEGRAVQQIIVE